jgi:hypothetical protein
MPARLPLCKNLATTWEHRDARLLKNHAFGSDEIKILTTAFESALRTLRLRPDRAEAYIAIS